MNGQDPTVYNFLLNRVCPLIPKELDAIARADNINADMFRNSSDQELLEVTHAISH